MTRERTRVDRIYSRYRASRRKRRAWAADNPGNVAIRRELLEAVRHHASRELGAGGEVLDVGCGSGFWLGALRDSGVQPPSRLFGVDVLPERVEAAKRAVPEATVLQADARSLPFEASRFSMVLLFTTLSSLATAADVQNALGEARRVLGPSGLLLCYEPRLRNPFNPRVRRITSSDFNEAGMPPQLEHRVTLLPPLARRLGTRTESLYPRLARIAPLRSHNLTVYRQLASDPQK